MSCDINSISFAVDPSNTPSFLLDWELTKLCNLDCTYCPVGIGPDAGHDNSTTHPPLKGCLQSIDFMYEYVDLYMKYKKPSQRKVVLNVYGGESLFHPDIVTILQECRARHEAYKQSWNLTILCTTNAIVGKHRWEEVIPLIDHFTLSYHSENNSKQKEMFKRNALRLQELNRSFNSILVMHNQPDKWDDCLTMIEFFKEHNLKYYPKPLDSLQSHWDYTTEQFTTLRTFWAGKPINNIQQSESGKINSLAQGRPCCGGRKLSLNGDLKSAERFVPRQGFNGWYCSVNWFFLYVQQFTGNIYTNKDCQMNLAGSIGPIGTLQRKEEIIEELKIRLNTASLPIIQCIKHRCICGFCAPKAESKETFLSLMNRNITPGVFESQNSCNKN